MVLRGMIMRPILTTTLTVRKKPGVVMRYATKLTLEENVREKGLEVIARNVQLIHAWVEGVDLQMGWGDPHKSFRLLRGWLHALRDSLPLSDVGNLSAQLPLIVRGLFFEQWKPTAVHVRMDSSTFLQRLDSEIYPDHLDNPALAAASVFSVFRSHIGEEEVNKLMHVLPHGIRELLSAH